MLSTQNKERWVSVEALSGSRFDCQVLIAECVSSHKVVAIFLLDDDLEDQITELHDTYPTVQFLRGSPTQTAIVSRVDHFHRVFRWSQVVQAINTLDSTVKVNVVHKGNSVFGLQVLNAIQKIPKGQTRSYSEVTFAFLQNDNFYQIAQEIGNPDAVRAVAGACARNNLAYIVPCHRVIGSSGNLSGYRWGISKKRSLLQAEGAQLNFAAM